jgi:DNA-directed RNA polymerase subunit M/transcription elongation factor TFIIS
MSHSNRCPDCKGLLHETGNEAEDGWHCGRCDRYVSAYELLTAADARIEELEAKLRATQITGEKVTLISEDDGPFRCVTCGVEPERVRQMAAELERLHGILEGKRGGENES